MNILIAPDTFKDSLSASEVSQAIRESVFAYNEKIRCFEIAASDGGEGFLDAVVSYVQNVKVISTQTVDPLGRPISANYLFDAENKTAYIELAKASGLELLSEIERNPMKTSTLGTGIQIKDAISKGATKIYIGIGGSATNDGGIGIAQALGYRFYRINNKELETTGEQLNHIFRLTRPNDTYSDISFYAVNDVLNPLFGNSGAAFVYGKQKGGNQVDIIALDNGLKTLHDIIEKELKINEAFTEGSGAAGGAAYGLKCFLKADFVSGTSFILNLSGFPKLIKENKIDLIITGEGKIDEQTGYGKFVYGLAQEAKKYNVPVFAICGKLALSKFEVNKIGLHGAVEIFDPSKPVAYSYENSARLISEKTTELLTKWYPNIKQKS